MRIFVMAITTPPRGRKEFIRYPSQSVFEIVPAICGAFDTHGDARWQQPMTAPIRMQLITAVLLLLAGTISFWFLCRYRVTAWEGTTKALLNGAGIKKAGYGREPEQASTPNGAKSKMHAARSSQRTKPNILVEELGEPSQALATVTTLILAGRGNARNVCRAAEPRGCQHGG
jgi:hypothetical protein